MPVIATMADYAVRVNSDPRLQSRNVTFASGGAGFGTFRFPPIQCSGTNTDVEFYTLALPTDVIVMFGMVELILIFWAIYKVSWCLYT